MVYNIVYCTDDNYCLPTVVSIVSFIDTQSPIANDGEEYHIYVICDEVSENNLDKISKIHCPLNFKIFVIDAVEAKSFLPLEEIHLSTNVKHVSRTAFLKFVLCRLLPNLKVVLYLDCDTLVLSDIREIFDIDLSSKAVVAVKDYPRKIRKSDLSYIEVNHDSYFNSGVMLLNLEFIRKNNLDRRLIAYRIVGYNKFQDQDAFNVVFSGYVEYANPFLNYLQVYEIEYTVYHMIYFFDMDLPLRFEDRLRLVKILHLAGPVKPWEKSSKFTDLFYKYYLLSPFSMEPLHLDRKVDNSISHQSYSYLRRICDWTKQKIFPSRGYFDYRLARIEQNQRKLYKQVIDLRDLHIKSRQQR